MPIAEFNAAIIAGDAEIKKGAGRNKLAEVIQASNAVARNLSKASQELSTLNAGEKEPAQGSLNMLASEQMNFITSKVGLAQSAAELVQLADTLPQHAQINFLSNHQNLIQTPEDLERVLKGLTTMADRKEFINTDKNLMLVSKVIDNLQGILPKEDMLPKLELAGKLLANVPNGPLKDDLLQRAVTNSHDSIAQLRVEGFNPIIQILNRLPPDIRGLEADGVRAAFAVGTADLLTSDKDAFAILQVLSPANYLEFLNQAKDIIETRESIDNLKRIMPTSIAKKFESMMVEHDPLIMNRHAIVEMPALPSFEDTPLEVMEMVSDEKIAIFADTIESTQGVEHAIHEINNDDDDELEMEIVDVDDITFAPQDIEAPAGKAVPTESRTLASEQHVEAENIHINEGPRRR